MKRISKKIIEQKEKGSIFPKLVISYFVFSLIALLVFFVGGFCILLFAGSGDINKLVPSELVAEDGTLDDLKAVYNADGWVERINDNYEVIEVYGNKKTADYKYTPRRLLELTRADDADLEYLHFYENYDGGSYLFCYPRSNLNIEFTFELRGVTSEPQEIAVIILFILLILADGILISVYIYRKIRFPLKQLMSGIQKMEKGERDFSISFRAEGEFVVIRDAFNRMLVHIKEEEEEKIKLQKDRHQMLLELSHDLKSPIATINNCAFALKEGVVAESERDKYYQMIAAKTNRVNEMADDMFTMLKMESNEYQPLFEKLDFNEFMRQVCAEYYNELEQSGFEVDIDIPENQFFINGDKKLLQRAIGNIFTNIMKHNRAGKSVIIKIFHKADKIMLIVADDGIPIEQGIFNNIFSAFVSSGKSRKHGGGTGLGLAIAKAVIDKHEGEIQYQYEDGRNQFIIMFKCRCEDN